MIITSRSGILMTTDPYPCCLKMAQEGKIRPETIMPLPHGAFAGLARDGSGKCCFDCSSAETLMSMSCLTFYHCRVAVGNDRQENLRLPDGIRQKYGLVGKGIVRTATTFSSYIRRGWTKPCRGGTTQRATRRRKRNEPSNLLCN